MKKCLIIDDLHGCIIPLLEQAGYAVDYRPGLSRSEVLTCIADYEGLIVRSKLAVDQELIDAAPNLRFVGRAGAGLDQLDVDALAARNIAILNAPEGNRDALAEHLVGMLLCLLNHIHRADRQVRAGEWDREGNRGTELMGKTVGLVGYGYMGQAFAQRLSGFGVTVLAYDKYRKDYTDRYATEATMDELHERAEVVSFHVPLTEETHHLVDKLYLDHFRKDIYLLNSARGKIMALETLLEAVDRGKVLGASLDVLESEPPAKMPPEQRRYFDRLSQSGRVLFTPHVGGWTHESYEKISRVLAQKIVALNQA
jgi:D-3-phosphoglycerate dehydrogenase